METLLNPFILFHKITDIFCRLKKGPEFIDDFLNSHHLFEMSRCGNEKFNADPSCLM